LVVIEGRPPKLSSSDHGNRTASSAPMCKNQCDCAIAEI
jgi:hypothetical protein